MKSCVVLDAMGVIFQAADDVEELLIPYILFWDDRVKNIAAAQSLGIESKLFKPDAGFTFVSEAMLGHLLPKAGTILKVWNRMAKRSLGILKNDFTLSAKNGHSPTAASGNPV
jgi:hypothetical protein